MRGEGLDTVQIPPNTVRHVIPCDVVGPTGFEPMTRRGCVELWLVGLSSPLRADAVVGVRMLVEALLASTQRHDEA